MQSYRQSRPTRPCPRHRSHPFAGRSTRLQHLILQSRRIRRLSRPYIPVAIRLCIVLFTVIQLRPVSDHIHQHSYDHLSIDHLSIEHHFIEHHFIPFISRAVVLSAITAAILSVIFFDTPIFAVIVIATLNIQFLVDLFTNKQTSFYQLFPALCFHCTAILFSTIVGRRRSIAKSSLLRTTLISKPNFASTLKCLRHVDVLEAAARLEASILTIDYSLSAKVGTTALCFTLPFAALFLAGYSTQRNGTVVILLLFAFSCVTEKSPILGFNFIKSITAIASTALSLFVGPGLLTVDQWLATAEQLCY